MSSRTHVPRIYHELQERGDGVAIRGGALMVSLNDVPQERGAPLSKEAQCTSEAAHQASEVESREGLRNPSYTADSLRARPHDTRRPARKGRCYFTELTVRMEGFRTRS